MSTRFGQVNLFVADMAAAVAFYRLLELEVPDPFEWPIGSGARHVEVHSDHGCYLALDNHPQARIWNSLFNPDRGEGNAVIGLLVDSRDDVDRLYDNVRAAGHPVGQEPYDAFWGVTVCDRHRSRHQPGRLKSPIDETLSYEPSSPR